MQSPSTCIQRFQIIRYDIRTRRQYGLKCMNYVLAEIRYRRGLSKRQVHKSYILPASIPYEGKIESKRCAERRKKLWLRYVQEWTSIASVVQLCCLAQDKKNVAKFHYWRLAVWWLYRIGNGTDIVLDILEPPLLCRSVVEVLRAACIFSWRQVTCACTQCCTHEYLLWNQLYRVYRKLCLICNVCKVCLSSYFNCSYWINQITSQKKKLIVVKIDTWNGNI